MGKDAPLLLPHLLKRIGDIKRGNLLVILEFEEFDSAVARHIDEDVGFLVREETFRARGRGVYSSYTTQNNQWY